MDDSRRLLRLATTTPKMFVEAKLYYRKKQGYILSVDSIEVDEGFVKIALHFDGVGRALVETAERFNQRNFDRLCDAVVGSDTLYEAITAVLKARGLELAPEATGTLNDAMLLKALGV